MCTENSVNHCSQALIFISVHSYLPPFKSSHSVLLGHIAPAWWFCAHCSTNGSIQHFEYHSRMYIPFFLSQDIIVIIACFVNTTKVFISINNSCFCGHPFPELSGFLSVVVILPGKVLRVSGNRHFSLIDVISHPPFSWLLQSIVFGALARILPCFIIILCSRSLRWKMPIACINCISGNLKAFYHRWIFFIDSFRLNIIH